MGKLAERTAAIARRCGDLSPLREPLRQLHLEGNRAAILAGRTPGGQPVAPLAPSTLKRRHGSGPPRAPQGAGSRVVTGCVVSVLAGPGRLSVTKSWPSFRPVEYFDTGTSRMPARPTMDFRPEDLERQKRMVTEYLWK